MQTKVVVLGFSCCGVRRECELARALALTQTLALSSLLKLAVGCILRPCFVFYVDGSWLFVSITEHEAAVRDVPAGFHCLAGSKQLLLL